MPCKGACTRDVAATCRLCYLLVQKSGPVHHHPSSYAKTDWLCGPILVKHTQRRASPRAAANTRVPQFSCWLRTAVKRAHHRPASSKIVRSNRTLWEHACSHAQQGCHVMRQHTMVVVMRKPAPCGTRRGGAAQARRHGRRRLRAAAPGPPSAAAAAARCCGGCSATGAHRRARNGCGRRGSCGGHSCGGYWRGACMFAGQTPSGIYPVHHSTRVRKPMSAPCMSVT